MESNILNEDEFIGKIFPQNCGDDLKVINRSLKSGYYECEFQKYPYKVIRLKNHIINGCVNNPEIEVYNFINKIHSQNCGDDLKIIKKTNISQGGGYLYECEFIKYPYKCLAQKQNILRGTVNNPIKSDLDFIGKEFLQNCGDSLKIIQKSKIKGNKDEFLYECEFQKYPCKIFAYKRKIKDGCVDNPALPWKSKLFLIEYIQENFKNKKPTLRELADSLNICYSHLTNKINEFELQNYLKLDINSCNENILRDYIISLNKNTLKKSTWNILKNKEIDIYIPSLKLGFEFNGNYWHSNLYKNQNYHQEKSLICQEKGINLIHIWEWEWLERQNIIKSLIKSKLGIFDKKIFARKCIIKELNYQEYKNFCNENHLQGECGAKVKLGLFYNDELIQIMSFSKPRFANNYEWEIIRECSKLRYCILGGKEKLWKYFLKNFNPSSVISYCDFSKFTGDSYLKLGFQKERLNKPGFVWWDRNFIYWRNPSKHQEYKDKYLKIYDCGQLVFVWNIKNK